MVVLISSISVFVGAIGIANVMSMSVHERRGEIGLLKASGWSNLEVFRLFIAEALWLGVLGGAIGATVGSLTGMLAEGFIPGLRVEPSLVAFLKGMGLAVLFSLIGGIIPSVRASRLSPIEAIRGA
ncbi:MAG: macrolide transporter ATP-binding /permease protein [Candidatus Bathyarchaeota archaeon BA1]|nr:MAG: macrolide transporter ATP-binding /permease protein [Candidatus Bathyarchaeota archaeon BA1]